MRTHNTGFQVYKVDELNSNPRERKIIFKQNLNTCVLVINLDFLECAKMAFIGFHATSNNWHKFTKTGYRSLQFFFENESDIHNDEKILNYFLEILKQENFVFSETEQISLFLN